MYTTMKYAADADGIATITIDVPGRPMNVLTPELLTELGAAVDAAVADPAVRGLVITSAKTSFIAGADLKDLVTAYDRGTTPTQGAAWSQSLSRLYRRIETCGKPVAAAVNGLALGGGLELVLACHYRVLASDPGSVIGLPEVKVGLLPGAGGTQRMVRIVGIAQAARLMTEGTSVSPAEALKQGLVHETAPAAEVVARARAWLNGTPKAVAPWDEKGFRVPGGSALTHPGVSQALSVGTALISRATMRNYPAPIAILRTLYEGASLPIDRALGVESKYFGQLLADPVARNLMRTMFINKGQLDKLVRRPAEPPRRKVTRLGVLGAGMMGAGIAHVAALAGISVTLIDATQEQAEKGRQHAQALLEKEVSRGRRSSEDAARVLARIEPTTDYARLADCELVIEAVFEDRDVKAEVTRRAVAAMQRGSVYASNTSTLPITGLASASSRPADFIGIHFFSPVEKMPLVEVILGKRTGDAALAQALDFVQQLKKTPIVVKDSRGFYTTRVFSSYCQEGQAMLAEGVLPALIENAARMAGMPVGPLAVSDEVSLELQYRATRQAEIDLGARFKPHPSWPLLKHLVEDLKRLGRKSGGGFYDYPADGPKRLWQGLATACPAADKQPDVAEVRMRLLHIQALEAARIYEEGIVTTVAEADIGSVLGIGFPAWTGGALSYIDTIGVATFVSECEKLARKFGKRYLPTKGLRERAKTNRTFHELPAGAPLSSAATG